MNEYKTISVLLPIQVPNNIYCNHKDYGRCFHFNFMSLTCQFNFKPIVDKEDNLVYKPKECLDLKWDI